MAEAAADSPGAPPPFRPLVPEGAALPPLGLGCARIASLTTKAGPREIEALLDRAWDGGIRLFDTADIYGQGDSERRLARIAARPGAFIVTKAGLALGGVSQTLVRLAKPLLRPVVVSAASLRKRTEAVRKGAEVNDLDPAGLRARLGGSLIRLGRGAVDGFLLHSPPRAALEDGTLFALLDALRAEGLARYVGISCRDLSDAAWVLDTHPVDLLEIPLPPQDRAVADPVLDKAAAQGIGVILREVLSGAPAKDALPPLLRDPRAGVVLTGTTNAAHLNQNLTLAGEAMNSDASGRG